MPKGKSPRISDKTLKKKNKGTAATWTLDKNRDHLHNPPKWENEDSYGEGGSTSRKVFKNGKVTTQVTPGKWETK